MNCNEFKKCPRCNIIKNKSEFNYHKTGRAAGQLQTYCKICNTEYTRELHHIKKIYKPMDKNKECPAYLGCVISERILCKIFNNVIKMPNNTPGYDFICGKGYKIDAKSACLIHHKNQLHSPNFIFHIRKNILADYFACIGFDDRKSLNPLKFWLIPGNKVNHLESLSISTIDKYQAKWSQYERPIDGILKCCTILRNESERNL